MSRPTVAGRVPALALVCQILQTLPIITSTFLLEDFMKSRFLLIIPVFLVLGTLATGGGPAQDLQRMAGTWSAVIVETSGKKTSSEEREKLKMKLVIQGESYTLFFSDEPVARGNLRLDESAQPSSIDIVPTDGPHKGQAQPGVYAFQGEDLWMVVAAPGQPRPTVFGNAPGVDGIDDALSAREVKMAQLPRKFEYQNTKYETNSKDQNTNDQNEIPLRFLPFGIFFFEFRICFEFRVSNLRLSRVGNLEKKRPFAAEVDGGELTFPLAKGPDFTAVATSHGFGRWLRSREAILCRGLHPRSA